MPIDEYIRTIRIKENRYRYFFKLSKKTGLSQARLLELFFAEFLQGKAHKIMVKIEKK